MIAEPRRLAMPGVRAQNDCRHTVLYRVWAGFKMTYRKEECVQCIVAS
jgi:hypothetical protein